MSASRGPAAGFSRALRGCGRAAVLTPPGAGDSTDSVRFRVEHLGQIASAELDIRPLTLFVGRNNTNKTWAAYALYGLLQQAAWGMAAGVSESFLAKRYEHAAVHRAIAPWVEKLVTAAFDPAGSGTQTGRSSMKVSRSELLPDEVQGITFHLDTKELAELLAVPLELTVESSATLELSRTEEPAASTELEIDVKTGVLSVSTSGDRFVYGRQMFFRLQAELRETLERVLSEFALKSILNVYPLPAERKALVAIYNHLRDAVEKTLPRPAADFVNLLRSTQARRAGDTLLELSDAPALLRGILEGSVDYAQAGPGWQPVYTPQQASFTLPIQAASSLVRAMAGLDLILEELGQGDVLLIDEVEMNAHPAAQLALVELLCTLVRAGVYVIMTSHSPYVVDHLNNLMLASTLPAETQERFRERFSLGTTDAFLPPDMVSAYLFERGGHVQDIMEREAGRISWTTFAEVSDQLSNLYADLDMAAAGSDEADG